MKNTFRVVLYNILIFTSLEISSEGKEFSSLSYACQWKPTRFSSSKACAERCFRFHGFIIPGTTKLVCFHDSKKSSVISEEGVKQCGYRTSTVGDRVCNPKILCENTTDEECMKKCGQYTVYISRADETYTDISYCGKTMQIKPRTRTLDGSGNQYYVLQHDGTRNNAFNCTCGYGEEGKEVKGMKRRKPRESIPNEGAPVKMELLCPIMFLEYDKKRCGENCARLNAIYSREDKKLICFHNERNVTMIQATAEHCICGIAYDDRVRLKHSGRCPSERKIPTNNVYDCPEKCENYKAYVFAPSKYQTDTVYCEYPSYVFKNMSYEIGKVVIVDNEDGSRKYRKYECHCGLGLSKSEINLKINFGQVDESYSVSDEPRNIQNNSQTRNYSDTRRNEKEIIESQSFAEFHIMENEEIDDLIKGSEFLYDLMQDDGYTSNNNSDFDNPIPGKKKKMSHRRNPSDVEIERGKDKAQLTHFEIPSMLRNIHASPNECFANEGGSLHDVGLDRNVIRNEGGSSSHDMGLDRNVIRNEGGSSSHDVGLDRNVIRNEGGSSSHDMGLDRNVIRNGRDKFRDTFAGTSFPSITNKYFAPSTSGIPDLPSTCLSNILPPEDFDPPPTLCHHTTLQTHMMNNNVGKESTLMNTGVSGNLPQYRGFMRNNASQNIRVGGNLPQYRGFMRNNTSQNIGVGGNLPQYRGFMLNNTSPNAGTGRSTSQNSSHILNITSQYMGLNASPNMGVDPSISPNRGLIINNMLQNMSYNLPNEIVETSEPVGDIYANMSFILPNEIMEMNEPVGDIYAPTMPYQHTPIQNDIINVNNNEDYEFLQNTRLSQNISQNVGLIPNNNTQESSSMQQNTGSINFSLSPSSDDNIFQDISAETGYPLFHEGEGNVSHRSIPDSPSLLFPNVTLEINELISSVKYSNPPSKFHEHRS